MRKCAIELDVSWEDRPEKRGKFGVEACDRGCGMEMGVGDTFVGGLSTDI